MKTATIGSAMIDIITIVADNDIERIKMTNAHNSFLLLEQGRKIDALNISTHVGGGAINAAVALSRLGHEVTPNVKIGEDIEAEMVRQLLEREKLSDKGLMTTDKAITGCSVIIASHDRNASIFTARGANCRVVDEDIYEGIFGDAKLVHIAPMSNESAEAFPMISKRARESGAFVVANPGGRQITRRGKEFLETAKNIDLININRSEAESLLPILLDNTKHSDMRSVKKDPSIAKSLLTRGLIMDHVHCSLSGFMSLLRSLGTDYILVTDGTGGSYLGTDKGLYHCPIHKTDKVKGTAGAGDSFTSTFGVLLAEGETPEKALQMAAINSSSVVEYVDTQSGLLSHKELDKRYAENADNLKVEFWPWQE
ncbi:carbohydrate kinase family protein [Cohaesibacter celericrescens]|uniref:Carbohydrate kinase family protein n=1 Tax=Cohaesibacter celericrescens TaxID=2067669 RepID=A0A2N5XSH3_9HYPH|nr:carbohydrate kinase family protein [Cohaesibacter celericrescens]PLW77463.1 carbohydrate kinase family protein [Cohaesibacter celericrescens]